MKGWIFDLTIETKPRKETLSNITPAPVAAPMAHHYSNMKYVSEECFNRCVKFFSKIGKGSNGRGGTIWNEHGVACQQYGERNSSVWNRFRSPFGNREFFVLNTDSSGELIFRKISYFRSVFEIVDGNIVIGMIRRRGVFRNRYSIDICGVGHWIFRMPLFSIRFQGESEDKVNIWVVVGPSKAEWNVLVAPDFNNRTLISVLAFIHNEYWNHG